MPRKVRIIVPDLPHHVIQRGNNHQDIFKDEDDRRYFLSNLKETIREQSVAVGAYCLMTNHIHVLLYPKTADGFFVLIKSLFQKYTQYFNRKYQRSGKLWENRYKIHLVDPDAEWVVARYIDRNPVRAKMVSRAQDYPYSSAAAHLAGKSNPLLTKDLIGNQRREYREFVYSDKADDQKHLAEIRQIIQQQKILGKDSFIQDMMNRFNIHFYVRKRGRPRKERE